ncbi:gamma-glutamylcyclotransferase family protein [Clostridium sp.]|uniref:gamma-glutamylcyclotransferase family protein n=1 Tax=Clostridium sp. TaxID=1506 RepID=UPI003D6D9CF8
MMKDKEEVYLFGYGTLMSSHRKGHTYLDGAVFKGECTLKGFALYDLGYYPGIVEDIEERVKGELYAVQKDKLSEIDIYEIPRMW